MIKQLITKGPVLGLALVGTLSATVAEAKEAGMPQFDFSTFPSQIFWLAVTITALFFLLNKMVVPRVSGILTEREDKISGDLSKAEELKAETEEAIATYEKALAEARAQAQEVMKETADAISKMSEEKNAEVSARLATQIQEGEKKIQQAKSEAMGDIRSIVEQTAVAAVDKLAGVSPAEADLAKAVDAVMKEAN